MTEKFLWVCELNKETPSLKWSSGDAFSGDDEDDKDFVYQSLILKTAMLGSKAAENQRNIVAIKTKGYQYKKEIDQPLFSLTSGKVDMIPNFDLTLAYTQGDHEVEFKLIEGEGPVFITCMHIIELPPTEDQTILTASAMEEEEEEEEIEGEEEEEAEAEEMEDDEKPKKTNGVKANGKAAAAPVKNGKANGKNGHAATAKKEELVEELPSKRKRN